MDECVFESSQRITSGGKKQMFGKRCFFSFTFFYYHEIVRNFDFFTIVSIFMIKILFK